MESETHLGVFARPGSLSSNLYSPHDLSTLNRKTSLIILRDPLVNEPMSSHLPKCMYPLKSEQAPGFFSLIPSLFPLTGFCWAGGIC